MKKRPILFSAPMVRALLAGTKTQTRRVIDIDQTETVRLKIDSGGWLRTFIGDATDIPESDDEAWMLVQSGFDRGMRCKYGQQGDRLWVREHHARTDSQLTPVHYFADGPMPTIDERHDAGLLRSYPSIHMPRWASRITLEITDVRVQRLQDINEEDAQAEGIPRNKGGCFYAPGHDGTTANYPDPQSTARSAYALLWDGINGHGSWDLNPWVWAINFRKV